MKKFVYILLFSVVVSFSFTSCKKTEYHKVSFEVTFLGGPSNGASNFIDVYVSPYYEDKKPFIDRFKLPTIWRYDYLALEKKQKVCFSVRGQLSYHFEMRVYIDDTEVSYRRVIVSNNSYYSDHVEESYGLNDKADEDTGVIQFIYN